MKIDVAKPVISLEQLTLKQGGKILCDQINVQMLRGQVWGILGANGAGKTTLLHSMAGLFKPTSGAISLCGNNIQHWPSRLFAQHFGVLLQDHSFSFPARVRELVLHGRHPHQSIWEGDSAEDAEIVEEALKQVDLLPLAERRVDQLSGGERQRMAIASILAQGCAHVLLDEPTNHLDLHYQIQLMQLLITQAQQLNGLIVASLHDLNLAARFCSHLLLMLGDGEVVAGPVEVMLSEDYLHRLYKHCIVKIEGANGRAFLPG